MFTVSREGKEGREREGNRRKRNEEYTNLFTMSVKGREWKEGKEKRRKENK